MAKRFISGGAALGLSLSLGLSVAGLAAEEESAKTHGMAVPVPAEKTKPEAEERHPSNEMKTLDAVAVRPVTFLSSLFSAGTFVLALPFAALDPALDIEKTRKNLVDYPFGDTFKRPLGDFGGSAW